MTGRNPVKDQVAIIGVGSTGFSQRCEDRSAASLTIQACTEAIRDAGLGAGDIDGVCGTWLDTSYVVSALGLTGVTHHANQQPPLGFTLIDAVNAIHAGACTAVVAYHTAYRSPMWSRAAAKDPFRRGIGMGGSPAPMASRADPDQIDGKTGYAAWTSRYLHETGAGREHLGYVAINGRTNARDNSLAAVRAPLTMQEYLEAPMVREPLSLLDLDIAVDGADAFVLTSAERARDLVSNPVLVHATASGITSPVEEDQIAGLHQHGQHLVARTLRDKSDLWLPEVDLFYPYDGCSFLTLSWIENLGWCEPGEGPAFLEKHWDPVGRILIDGRIPVNTNGGGLSEGATQGSGHLREAVVQLRGSAGPRQVANAQTALLAIGGFFFNSQGVILRSP